MEIVGNHSAYTITPSGGRLSDGTGCEAVDKSDGEAPCSRTFRNEQRTLSLVAANAAHGAS